MGHLVPMVVEQTRAANARTIFIRACSKIGSFSSAGAIDDHMANLVIAQLLFLEKEDPDKDIDMYVNSPGRQRDRGLAMYDAMRFIKPDVATICMGMAASMGSILLTGGAPGKRYRPAARQDPDPPALGLADRRPGHRRRNRRPRPDRDPPDGRPDLRRDHQKAARTRF